MSPNSSIRTNQVFIAQRCIPLSTMPAVTISDLYITTHEELSAAAIGFQDGSSGT